MVETAAHLTDHVFPHLPVRQWVLSVPKRLRYFLQRDGDVQDAALRILMRVVLRSLHRSSPGAAGLDKVHIGACAFVHRFGSSLNTHVHFHCCVVDGVFEATYPGGAAAPGSDQPAGIRFHPASDHDEAASALAQADCRRRLLRAFVTRGLIDAPDAKEMNGREHGGGFSLDASVRIDGDDRNGLERLLRYCARPPFAMDRLHRQGPDRLIYHCPKPQPGGTCADLSLTPLELIDRIAALVPPPRKHRLRYFGAFAPNSALRNVVTALARGDSGSTSKTPVAGAVAAIGSSARYAWAALIARIYEVFPLLCLHCGGQMRIIAFITAGGEVKKILDHLGVDSRPPRITPARGPPLWDQRDMADMAEAFDAEVQADLMPASPEFQFDQRIDW